MGELKTQSDLRAVRNLPFCYLCGEPFGPSDASNHDHVPPKAIFATKDRQPLKLKTHESCNSRHSMTDEKIGQLISLQRQKFPARIEDRKLQVAHLGIGIGAVTNLHIDGAIWRWIGGFHAALYREPLTKANGSIVTPFPRADMNSGGYYVFRPLYPQHEVFVETIKSQRIRGALDRIEANNGAMVYECVWGESDSKEVWLCIFALNIYDWKWLGASPLAPPRGCTGCYVLPARPPSATRVTNSGIVIPNFNPLDPFSP
jgi:hypothetical protein